MNTARFKGYTPDARIVAHLRTRAKEFNVDVPTFLRKKQQDQRDPLGKRKFKNFQHYLVNEETDTDAQVDQQVDHTQLYMKQVEHTQLYMSKSHPKGLGKGKGKGKKGHKGGKGGYRSQQPRPMLAFDNIKGKGKGKPSFQGNFGSSKGKSKSSSQKQRQD
jgi:hypothetical protein